MLKTGKDIIKGHLLELFNRILSSGKYPTLWSFALIVPIYKKDDRSKAELPRHNVALCIRDCAIIIRSGGGGGGGGAGGEGLKN